MQPKGGRRSIAGVWRLLLTPNSELADEWLEGSVADLFEKRKFVKDLLSDSETFIRIDPDISTLEMKRGTLISHNVFPLDGSEKTYLPILLDSGPATWCCTSRNYQMISGVSKIHSSGDSHAWQLELQDGGKLLRLKIQDVQTGAPQGDRLFRRQPLTAFPPDVFPAPEGKKKVDLKQLHRRLSTIASAESLRGTFHCSIFSFFQRGRGEQRASHDEVQS
eukprot:TRINITY_DN66180_c0_g1_i1.p1 TRINITY_DN66180_c0_g1~~TRINITY_DN66180_c0_g1_i1.p1  ORF type:complete len:220 (-),score=36.08 TRINITY_DN66180_c0_g1_i1:51-710(-)